jgi:phage recombination protein Bet
MTNELVLTDEKLAQYLDLFGYKDIPKEEKIMFIELCKMNGLNPFKREVHISAYGSGANRQFAIITGYETYIKRAELSGRLNGWETSIEQCKTAKTDIKGKLSFIEDLKATVTIYRKDFDKPFTHSVKFSEYVQTTRDGNVTKFWTKAESQLKKVAISQGFRLCFNEVLGGMPYTKEEMPDEESQTIDITREQNAESLKLNTPSSSEPSKKELLPDFEGWNDAVMFVRNSSDFSVALDKIRKKYILSEENAGQLVAEASEINEDATDPTLKMNTPNEKKD